MKPVPNISADKLINNLAGLGELRVWSVIVTIFGDFALPMKESIAAAELSRITTRIGIKPDAFRVAIHRLKNDGWITAVRQGRNSHYRLTDHGFLLSNEARARIYATAAPEIGQQFVAVAPPLERAETSDLAARLETQGFEPIAPRVFLGNRDFRQSELLILRPVVDSVPTWLQAKIGTQNLNKGYALLVKKLKHTQVALINGLVLSESDKEVLRILIIHRWRQLLLHHPDLPVGYFPDDWQGEICRNLVQKLLKRLPPGKNHGLAAFGAAVATKKER